MGRRRGPGYRRRLAGALILGVGWVILYLGFASPPDIDAAPGGYEPSPTYAGEPAEAVDPTGSLVYVVFVGLPYLALSLYLLGSIIYLAVSRSADAPWVLVQAAGAAIMFGLWVLVQGELLDYLPGLRIRLYLELAMATAAMALAAVAIGEKTYPEDRTPTRT